METCNYGFVLAYSSDFVSHEYLHFVAQSSRYVSKLKFKLLRAAVLMHFILADNIDREIPKNKFTWNIWTRKYHKS